MFPTPVTVSSFLADVTTGLTTLGMGEIVLASLSIIFAIYIVKKFVRAR